MAGCESTWWTGLKSAWNQRIYRCQQGTVVSSDHVRLPSAVSWPNFQQKNELVVFGAPSSTVITRLLQGQLIVLAHFHLLGGARHGALTSGGTGVNGGLTNREIGLIAYRVTSSMTLQQRGAVLKTSYWPKVVVVISIRTHPPRIDRPTMGAEASMDTKVSVGYISKRKIVCSSSPRSPPSQPTLTASIAIPLPT